MERMYEMVYPILNLLAFKFFAPHPLLAPNPPPVDIDLSHTGWYLVEQVGLGHNNINLQRLRVAVSSFQYRDPVIWELLTTTVCQHWM